MLTEQQKLFAELQNPASLTPSRMRDLIGSQAEQIRQLKAYQQEAEQKTRTHQANVTKLHASIREHSIKTSPVSATVLQLKKDLRLRQGQFQSWQEQTTQTIRQWKTNIIQTQNSLRQMKANYRQFGLYVDDHELGIITTELRPEHLPNPR